MKNLENEGRVEDVQSEKYEPTLGMLFDSHEDMWQFYNAYGKQERVPRGRWREWPDFSLETKRGKWRERPDFSLEMERSTRVEFGDLRGSRGATSSNLREREGVSS
ncbi:hypothetical protein CISIN_1g034061mg [Citrus sinensis]|uniref:Uncharacterized protein n=1 Tax=Citrus sinensis TaxID=2711 RepID=A0A067FEF2_CITSI|nr:hypothetical protein CISIN_1g034061mg [Citrus sinensis]